ncbi:mitochondrial antiviral-signaling protein isoform X2 [Bombina bombina]|uniref:mitochondrial antiviral-signaling protein isoform X2 n=1 Tax=Bombina bombina TaxID=8345 RepID=UPI00235ABE5C|nr:mitochondrial antiviral-signaling protein isoform X2 [Bombina bombina]
MGFAEDKLADYLRSNISNLEPLVLEELLLHITCLTQATQEKLRQNLQNHGNTNTLWHFIDHMRRRPFWVDDLLKALQKCKYYDLASTIKEEYNKHLPGGSQGSQSLPFVPQKSQALPSASQNPQPPPYVPQNPQPPPYILQNSQLPPYVPQNPQPLPYVPQNPQPLLYVPQNSQSLPYLPQNSQPLPYVPQNPQIPPSVSQNAQLFPYASQNPESPQFVPQNQSNIPAGIPPLHPPFYAHPQQKVPSAAQTPVPIQRYNKEDCSTDSKTNHQSEQQLLVQSKNPFSDLPPAPSPLIESPQVLSTTPLDIQKFEDYKTPIPESSSLDKAACQDIKVVEPPTMSSLNSAARNQSETLISGIEQSREQLVSEVAKPVKNISVPSEEAPSTRDCDEPSPTPLQTAEKRPLSQTPRHEFKEEFENTQVTESPQQRSYDPSDPSRSDTRVDVNKQNIKEGRPVSQVSEGRHQSSTVSQFVNRSNPVSNTRGPDFRRVEMSNTVNPPRPENCHDEDEINFSKPDVLMSMQPLSFDRRLEISESFDSLRISGLNSNNQHNQPNLASNPDRRTNEERKNKFPVQKLSTVAEGSTSSSLAYSNGKTHPEENDYNFETSPPSRKSNTSEARMNDGGWAQEPFRHGAQLDEPLEPEEVSLHDSDIRRFTIHVQEKPMVNLTEGNDKALHNRNTTYNDQERGKKEEECNTSWDNLTSALVVVIVSVTVVLLWKVLKNKSP